MKTRELNNGNNEKLSKAIEPNGDGTYTVVSFSRSKTFKTASGAIKCAKNWGLI